MKMLRLQRGLTLEEVGNRVGVGKSTVRKWENGQIANMRRDKIALVAKALGVKPSYLMGWDDGGDTEADIVEPTDIWGDVQNLSGIDFALSGEIHDLDEDEKQDVLDYVRFKKSQRAKKD